MKMSDVVGETLDGLVLKGTPKDDTLEASLEAYTKPNLIKLAESNDFEVKKSWNKDQMIQVISEGLRESLDERLSTFEDEQLAVLQKISNGDTAQVDVDSEVISSAVSQGLLYVTAEDDEVLYTLPTEFEEKLNEAADQNDAVEDEPVAEPVKQPARTVPFARRPQRKQPVQQRIVGKKVGRNEPCPCGSGKKYKKCCWSKDQKSKSAV